MAEKEVRVARLDALKKKLGQWAREGGTSSEWDAASRISDASRGSGLSKRSGARKRPAASFTRSVCLLEKEVTGMKRLLQEQDTKNRNGKHCFKQNEHGRSEENSNE